MLDFTERAIAIIRSIPPGKVMTYGGVAASAGSPRAARQVVRILHAMSERHGLPWHRVINARGEIGIREPFYRELQMQLLEEEGVSVGAGGRVNLESCRFEPDPLL